MKKKKIEIRREKQMKKYNFLHDIKTAVISDGKNFLGGFERARAQLH